MSPGRALNRSLSMMFTTRGRTGRTEFWWTAFLSAPCYAALAQLPRWTSNPADAPSDLLILMFATIALLSIMVLTAACRRLHDSGHRTGWILLILVPVLGWVALTALLLMRGTHGPNEHGSDPAPWRNVPRGDHPALDALADAEEQRIADVRRYYAEMVRNKG